MPILKPIDNDFVCVTGAETPDQILAGFFAFNGMAYIETDIAGSQLQNLDPYSFFGVNRVLNFAPVENNARNRYSNMRYNCMLTFAKPADSRLEVETVSGIPGQFDTITKELLKLEFINTLKSYFACCDYPVSGFSITPIWNSNRAVPAINHTGVEINFTVMI